MERHPDAKVILSVRDPKRWYESVRNTIYELSVVVPRHPLYRIGYTFVRLLVFRGPGNIDLAHEIIWQGTFDGRFEDENHAIEVFEPPQRRGQTACSREQATRLRCKVGLGTPV